MYLVRSMQTTMKFYRGRTDDADCNAMARMNEMFKQAVEVEKTRGEKCHHFVVSHYPRQDSNL